MKKVEICELYWAKLINLKVTSQILSQMIDFVSKIKSGTLGRWFPQLSREQMIPSNSTVRTTIAVSQLILIKSSKQDMAINYLSDQVPSAEVFSSIVGDISENFIGLGVRN